MSLNGFTCLNYSLINFDLPSIYWWQQYLLSELQAFCFKNIIILFWWLLDLCCCFLFVHLYKLLSVVAHAFFYTLMYNVFISYSLRIYSVNCTEIVTVVLYTSSKAELIMLMLWSTGGMHFITVKVYSSPSILRPPLIIRPLHLVLKDKRLNDLYFKTTCNQRPHF